MSICRNHKIKKIEGRQILDSRGNWTIEVELLTEGNVFSAGVPSGASKGKYEAKALEVKKAIKNINEIIAPRLIGKNPANQKEIDNFLIKLDGTKNKSKLGANALCGVSMANCRAGAAAKNIPLYQHIFQIFNRKNHLSKKSIGDTYGNLPVASFNVINGGAHAGNDLDVQEFMIAPQAGSFSESLGVGAKIYLELKNILAKKYGKSAINLGDEGGFAPPIALAEEALDLILEAAKKLGYQKKIKIILDAAASQFYFKGKQGSKKSSVSGSYKMKTANFDSQGLLNYYLTLVKKYPIMAIEDPFDENDWQGWQLLNSKFKIQNSKFLIIGDDLLATNPERIKRAKKENACNGLLLKVNQIGTVSEALEAAGLAKSYGWKIMVSHRSGETNDDFIADLAVGIGADFIKSGAPARGERVAKYNRLLKIEENLLK